MKAPARHRPSSRAPRPGGEGPRRNGPPRRGLSTPLANEAPAGTPAEAATFLAATGSDPLGLMFRIAVLRGLRRGELCGLRWASADLEAGVLVVDHTILEPDGHLVDGVPKTAAGVRRVYLDAETAELLRRAPGTVSDHRGPTARPRRHSCVFRSRYETRAGSAL